MEGEKTFRKGPYYQDYDNDPAQVNPDFKAKEFE
jgi:hypothetical protein